MQHARPTCPLWIEGKMSREIISPILSEKRLKKLRDDGEIKSRPIGIIQKGSRQGQATKWLYYTPSLLTYLDDNSLEEKTDEGGATMSKNGWSEKDSHGRSRKRLAKGFQIIERPANGGKSYDFVYREKVVENGVTTATRKPRVMEAKNQEDAEKEGMKLIVLMNEKKELITLPDGGGNPTISQLASDFLEYKKEDVDSYSIIENIVNSRLVPFFGPHKLEQIKLQHQFKYRNKRRKTVADSTIRMELQYLNALYNYTIDMGIYDGANPVNIAKLKLQITERERYMEPEEEKVIWPILSEYEAMEDLSDFLYGTTMRPVNIISLPWTRINWIKKEAFVPKAEHKNRKKDGKYLLTAKVLKMLKRRQEENEWDFPYVFWRLVYGRPAQIKKRWIQRQWEDIMTEAGIRKREEKEGKEPLRFYDLKHTRLSRLGARGATVLELKRISNHTNTASLERYVKGDALNGVALRLMEEDDSGKGVSERSN